MQDLGARIRRLRLRKGYTLVDLAQATESSSSYIWKLECGRVAYPSVHKLSRLAAALDVGLDVLLEEQA